MTIEAMKQALEFFDNLAAVRVLGAADEPIRTALRQAIEQAEKQEPVAWRGYNWGHSPDDWVYRDFDDPILDGNGNNVGQPLYTTPPQRKPLTRGQIREIEVDVSLNPSFDYITPAEQLCRAIEAAHGIKENT